ncbi:hypothetical protein [Oceanicoccus sp. KOV_DT_Chl]|uniref:hypothetical protein n=1 Tax=Oceanicoccus sp. KOV_DT_Chl TaxID=1904639 RepID=UPI000C79F1D2|nr:hypothetical protein [Oceanicoccus sp. KOV_DT_Chl]
MKRTLSIVAIGCSALLTSLSAQSGPLQLATNDLAKGIQLDCLLEGRVVAERSSDNKSIVRIDFYKAQPYKIDSRCIISGKLEFNEPKGSLIENLSTGSVVQYHYHRSESGIESWQLVARQFNHVQLIAYCIKKGATKQ